MTVPLKFTEHENFLRINGDTVEKIKFCFLTFFPSHAKLLPSCFPLALGELRVVLVESLHSVPNATVMGWERAKKPASFFLLKFRLKGQTMLNKTCVSLESQSLKHRFFLYCKFSTPEETCDLIDLK